MCHFVNMTMDDMTPPSHSPHSSPSPVPSPAGGASIGITFPGRMRARKASHRNCNAFPRSRTSCSMVWSLRFSTAVSHVLKRVRSLSLRLFAVRPGLIVPPPSLLSSISRTFVQNFFASCPFFSLASSAFSTASKSAFVSAHVWVCGCGCGCGSFGQQRISFFARELEAPMEWREGRERAAYRRETTYYSALWLSEAVSESC